MKQLEQLADGVWHLQSTMNVVLGVQLPLRMTVLRDRDGGILLYSPLAIDDAAAAEIDGLGEVRFIIGPNLLHHLHLKPAQARWPKASLLGAAGLPEKRSGLKFDGVLKPGALSPGVRAFPLDGIPRINETVLLHEPSGSLVCADLTFRIQEASGWSKTVLRMMDAYGSTLRRDRLFNLMIRDRDALAASLHPVFDSDFDAVVMAHGDPVMRGGKDQLQAIY